MAFLTFNFVYWPFLFVTWLIFVGLPPQRVREEQISWFEIKVALVFFLLAAGGSAYGALVWRSTSSDGFKEIRY